MKIDTISNLTFKTHKGRLNPKVKPCILKKVILIFMN